MRSKFLLFFRENPVLLLVPAMLVLAWLFVDPAQRAKLGDDPEGWFRKNGEFSFRLENCRVSVNGNGTWNVTVAAVMSVRSHIPTVVRMPERGEGTWRVEGNDLIFSDQVNTLGHPFNFGSSRLSDDGDFLRVALPSGRAHLLVPRR